jgi:aminoglycoside/choline kinase family phosphotransferase
VPEILAEDKEDICYLQTDLGDKTLFSLLPHDPAVTRFGPEVIDLYKKVLDVLPEFQVKAAQNLDFEVCYPRHAFDKQSMMWDLNYFKYYFLKTFDVAFDEQKLEDDFEVFTRQLLNAPSDYFLYRDFQSRNIMVVGGNPFFIDFQGGRRGALQYDIASLLFDAKASIPFDQRVELLDHYVQAISKHVSIDQKQFKEQYYNFVFIRIFQALGAYGFRGGVERKTLFLQSIPYALRNIKWLAENNLFPKNTPHLTKVLDQLVDRAPDHISPKKKEGLTVQVYSFSYKRGIPLDDSGNGGGFVFDCRALPNPGRFDQYKTLSGLDAPVIDFLKKEKAVYEFIENAKKLTDASISNYIERGFSNLMVGFGCTGGQHRSVYCAEHLSKYITDNHPVKVELIHNEAKNWKK